MMYLWKPDMIRFMRDASERTDYHRLLSERIVAELGPHPVIVDAGCGLGYLSLALSGNARQVFAVDKHPDALSVLEENIKTRNVANVLPLCVDIDELSLPEQPDAAVFCFFGDGKQIVRFAKQLGVEKAITIGSALGHSHCERERIDELLVRLEAPHKKELFSLSLDQPFASEADARLFFEIYHTKEPYSGRSEEDFFASLVADKDPAFPLRMPIEKELCMTAFCPADLPEEV